MFTNTHVLHTNTHTHTIAVCHFITEFINLISVALEKKTTPSSSSSQSLFSNTCGCRTSSTWVSTTQRSGEWRPQSRWRPGNSTGSSLNRAPPPWDVWLPCVSWRTRSRKQPGPKAQRGGPGVSETAPLSSLCNYGKKQCTSKLKSSNLHTTGPTVYPHRQHIR